ncbi:phage holin family protein [Aureivirga marina]|uniref:phage holin family protein n=1 Tax=Aureivirga marina TaxID=1182451 RepID=UPI0018CA8651|nr:phage holin family protein [Aureivirga marina]
MNILNSLDKLSSKVIDLGNDYVNNSTEYFKLKIFYHLTKSFTFGIKLIILLGLSFFALVFLSVALVVWIGDVIGSFALACVLVAVLFLLIGFLIYLLRKNIDRKVIQSFSEDYFDESI